MNFWNFPPSKYVCHFFSYNYFWFWIIHTSHTCTHLSMLLLFSSQLISYYLQKMLNISIINQPIIINQGYFSQYRLLWSEPNPWFPFKQLKGEALYLKRIKPSFTGSLQSLYNLMLGRIPYFNRIYTIETLANQSKKYT